MPDLIALPVAFLLGSACALGLVLLIVLRRRAQAPQATAGRRPRATGPRYELVVEDAESVERATDSLASELADLSTGIEGHAQLLCEAIGDPEQVASQAQRLWSTVRKLRLFSDKVVSSCRPPVVKRVPTDVGALVTDLRQELEDYSGAGLQVKCEVASSLPKALADPDALRHTCLFLVDTLLDLETDAGVLVLRAATRVVDDHAPSVELEIRVESENAPLISPGANKARALGFVAARKLLKSLGAKIRVEHTPGLCSTARIHLEAAPADAGPVAPPEAAADRPRHPFGGILIVEDEPSVRSLVAREMEKTGRRVFCCADGAAARSLFQATPERFELLILDREARRQPGVVLAAEALSLCPDLKILLLGAEPRPGEPPGPDLGPWSRVLHKPFGITELRDAVGGMLAPEAQRRVGA